MPEPVALTLYEIAEEYQAMLDTEALVTPETEADFEAQLREVLLARDARTDSVAKFMLFLGIQRDQIKTEIARLRKRDTLFENAEERMRRYVLGVIKFMGLDAKGKYKKLLSPSATMYARSLPAAVEIQDEDAIPDEFKSITLEMPLDLWRRIAQAHPELEMHSTLGIIIRRLEVETKKIQAAIEAGVQVPGADLKLAGHDYTLVVR